MNSSTGQFILSILLLSCIVNIVLARNVTCNRFSDKYALNHTFFTGYLDVGIDDPITGLGFVFYSKVNALTDEEISQAPTLIWLNGGPGDSSMIGAYFENGPYRVISVNGSKVIQENPDSWTNKYNILYIDQPISVGFSRSANDSNLPTSDAQVASQFYKGLLSFYSQSGCYNSSIFLNSPLFISGESYAGKYIPNIAAEIIRQNQNASLTGNTIIPLNGIFIGSPLIDPQHQFQQISQFGLENNIISNQIANLVNENITIMNQFFDNKQYVDGLFVYQDIIDYFMEHRINASLDNVYNYKINRYPDQFIEDHCENYIKQFGFDQDFAYGSTKDLIASFLQDEMFRPNGIPALQFVLANNLPVFFFNGENDILINTPGVKTFINSFSWSGNVAFASLKMKNLNATINGKDQSIGAYKWFKNLFFATIIDAGHRIPYDQPQSISIFLDQFISKVLKTMHIRQHGNYINNNIGNQFDKMSV